jgi:ribosomal protein L12E/L44/L45/RPP1/RPP2
MKRIVLVICLTLAGQAWAQAPKPAAPAAAPAKPAAQEAAKPAMQASAKPRKPNPKRSEDARHCLDKTSNTEVIKCAEEYL